MIEYFSQNLWQFWTLASVLCLILELTNGDFYIMCFAIGAAVTAIFSAFGVSFNFGLVVFATISILSIFFVRPGIIKLLHKNESSRPSNADALFGQIGTVSLCIEENGYGRVAIDGDDWKAVSENGQKIEKGKKVIVVDRESIILKVRETV